MQARTLSDSKKQGWRSSGLPSHFEVKDLPYNIDMLFALVADVEKYPEFLPWVAGARILKSEGDVRHAELKVSYKGFSESYVSKVTLVPPTDESGEGTIDVTLERGPFKKLRNYWVFRKIDEKNTQVEFFVDFEFKSIIVEKLAGGAFASATKKMMQAFEERAAAKGG